MRKVDLINLLETSESQELGDGARLLECQEIIEIKKEAVEMLLLIQGAATVIFKEAGKKEMATISMGEACFFGSNDESVVLQENSRALVVDRNIRKAESSGRKIGFFGKKGKSEQADRVEASESATKNSILSDMLPKVRQVWFQVAGPLSASIVNDEDRFKGLAASVYSVLPMPIRMVVKEDFFVVWCYEKRHLLLVEGPEALDGSDEQLALAEAAVDESKTTVDGDRDEKANIQ